MLKKDKQQIRFKWALAQTMDSQPDFNLKDSSDDDIDEETGKNNDVRLNSVSVHSEEPDRQPTTMVDMPIALEEELPDRQPIILANMPN